MKKVTKSKHSSAPRQVEPDVIFLISTMQQQLISLERKIDTLIRESSKNTGSSDQSPRRSFRDRNFSKPRDNFGERSFTQVTCAACKKDCEIPFKPRDDRPVYCKECFSKRKDGDSFSGSSFKGRRNGGFGGENQRRGRGNKPTFRRRRERG